MGNPNWYYTDDRIEAKENFLKTTATFHYSWVPEKEAYLFWYGYKWGVSGEVTWEEFYQLFKEELDRQENKRLGIGGGA